MKDTEVFRIERSGSVFAKVLPSGSGYALNIDGSGQILKNTSSARYKTDIRDLPSTNLDALWHLRPVLYKNKTGEDRRDFVGLIAEEVESAGLKDVVIHDAQGRPDAIMYDRLTAVLIQAVKELKTENQALAQRVAELEKTSPPHQ